MAKIYVVIDNPPLETSPWATQLAAAAKLTLVDNAKVTEWISKNPEAQKAFLGEDMKKPVDPLREQNKIAPHYRAALEQLYPADQRVLLWGNAWIAYVPVSAFVLDWTEVEKRASGAPANDKGSAALFKQTAKNFVGGRVKSFLPAGKMFELPLNLSDADRTAKTVEILRKVGV